MHRCLYLFIIKEIKLFCLHLGLTLGSSVHRPEGRAPKGGAKEGVGADQHPPPPACRELYDFDCQFQRTYVWLAKLTHTKEQVT